MLNVKSETCGKRIEKALKIREMKQADLCKLTGISKSSLSLYLKGAYSPKQDKIYKMAIALNVSEKWLCGYDVPMEREETHKVVLGLTTAERIMLELFRRIPENQQKILIQLIRDGLRNQQ